jgi:hypothetical protein
VPKAIHSGNVHYEINSSSGEGYVDLFRSNIIDIYKKELVLQAVYGEYLSVSADGNYIACAIPISGEPQYSIYNVEQKKHSLLKDPELNDENYYPIFSFDKGRILYYRPNDTKLKEMAIPETYTYDRNANR